MRTRTPEQETDWLLTEWSRWAMVNPGVSLGYPSRANFDRARGSTVASPLIRDDEALMIDGVVSKLAQHNKEIHEAVVTYYFLGSNISRTAKKMGASKTRTRELIGLGASWVCGALSIARIN